MNRGAFCLSSLVLAFVLAVPTGSASAQELDNVFDSSSRDARMRSITWDYQPGQAARRTAPARVASSAAYQGQYQAAQPQAVVPTQTIKAVPGTTHTTISVPEAPAEKIAPKDPTAGLRNLTGVEVGGQFSHYDYREPGPDNKWYGYKFGVNSLLTKSFYDGWFVRGDLRFAAGDTDYDGTGTSLDEPSYLFEIRALGGKDFLFGRFSVAPFTGIGFRYLKSDGRGVTTSAGSSGYRRESEYLYVPLGIQPRMRLDNGDHLALSIEYDFFAKGWVNSLLHDIDDGYPDILNQQDNGYGIRGELMYLMNKWSFGPFFNYWNIGSSNYKCGFGTTDVYCGSEPYNQTVEWGAQFRYKFY